MPPRRKFASRPAQLPADSRVEVRAREKETLLQASVASDDMCAVSEYDLLAPAAMVPAGLVTASLVTVPAAQSPTAVEEPALIVLTLTGYEFGLLIDTVKVEVAPGYRAAPALLELITELTDVVEPTWPEPSPVLLHAA